jgi:hypothetical protein
LNNSRTRPARQKKWTGWFRPERKGLVAGPLTISPVSISPEKLEAKGPAPVVIISVPSACGSAVQRNRFRRIIRGYYSLHTPPASLWIRLSNRCRLDRKIRIEQFEASLVDLQSRLFS